MSSSGFASTLDLRLGSSHRALRWLYVIHLVPLALLPFAVEPGLSMALVALALGASWFWLRRHPAFGFGPRAIERLVWQPTDGPDAGWHLYDQVGRNSAAKLLDSTYVTPHLMVLNFRLASGKRRSRALLGDELPPDSLRRLRARLISGRRDGPPAADASG